MLNLGPPSFHIFLVPAVHGQTQSDIFYTPAALSLQAKTFFGHK